jgi:hypothetical protein
VTFSGALPELFAGGVLAGVAAAVSLRVWPGPRARNHRGLELPVSLGVALGVGLAAGWVASRGQAGGVGGRAGVLLVGALLVGAAGLVDDAVADAPRGLRGHLRELAAGRVTTGILKLVVVTGAAVVSVASIPGRGTLERAAGVALLAGGANLWNGLDVAPGRALKGFALAGIPLAAFGGIEAAALPALPASLGAAVALAWPDLRERAMLGDGGSNTLGFVVGQALYLAVPGGWVVVAAVIAVALNVLAETVTLSRAIAAVGPLRALDRLGRRSG